MRLRFPVSALQFTRKNSVVAAFGSLSCAIVIAMLCSGEASAQIVYTSATCNGTTGQTLNNICFPHPLSGVMSGPTNAYVIYYGQWPSSTQAIINN